MAAELESVRNLLLQLFDEAFDHKAWHGPNLRGALRRVDAKQASWRPGSKRHSIAEIAVHCAYWKYATRRRIRNDKRGSFPLKGSNWFQLESPLSQATWKGYLRLLDAEHEALRDTLKSAPWERLASPDRRSATPAPQVYGIVLHDTYHAGQIRILKSLYNQK